MKPERGEGRKGVGKCSSKGKEARGREIGRTKFRLQRDRQKGDVVLTVKRRKKKIK